MNRKCANRVMQTVTFALILAAVCQELEKPKEERVWHGRIARFVPYDFRLPTPRRIIDTFWNPYERRVFMPQVFGIGWTINFHALLENMGIIKCADVSEEDFLMPTESMKNILKQSQTPESANSPD